MKNARQEKIMEIVDKHSIDSQENLLVRLKKAGINATQATISRDIRDLHLVKVAIGGGKYRYTASYQKDKQHRTPSRFEVIFKESVVKVDRAGFIVLVQCFSGMANAACELFDAMVWEDVAGTLSGDDTFLILTKSDKAASLLCEKLEKFIAK